MGIEAGAKAIERHIRSSMGFGARPIPLKSTSYDIDIRSGLAVVRLERKFRNDEKRSIEATITFPVAFDAVVSEIEAKVGDRILIGAAKAKLEARAAYENAIDRGKPAVLHEELLRGLHMLSVANVAPGAEIVVTATFALPLELVEGNGRIRIPVTVGQIYGEQPLVESDALLNGGPADEAEVKVTSDAGTALVNGSALSRAISRPKLDRPIEVKLVGYYRGVLDQLFGRAADGRLVTMQFSPTAPANVELDIDVLLDVSGSMDEPIDSTPEEQITKWGAVRSSLSAASGSILKKKDRVNVWTFATHCHCHGSVRGDAVAAKLASLPFERGGTELAGAVAAVTAARSEANVLLVTDGMSWRKIDTQRAIATGARFTVVLVGEDSLEASVGYLAAMTGGQMFVVEGSGVDGALSNALASMRNVGSPVTTIKGQPQSILRRLAGTDIKVEWSEAVEPLTERNGFAAAVAAFAAQLAIPGMDEVEAAHLAEAEGIVSHLTSIVLVDEAAEAVEGIPATRKIALPFPAASAASDSIQALVRDGRISVLSSPIDMSRLDSECSPEGSSSWLAMPSKDRIFEASESIPNLDLEIADHFTDAASLRGLINWDLDPDALGKGDLSGRAPWLRAAVLRISGMKEVQELAASIGKDAIAVAVALVAELDTPGSRTAARIARSVLKGANKCLLEAARQACLNVLA